MKKTISITLLLLCCAKAFSQGGAGGGGGGGQNLYGFRYIIMPLGPVEPVKDSAAHRHFNSLRYELIERWFLGPLRGALKIKGYDSLKRDVGTAPAKHFVAHKIKYRFIDKHHLEVAILSRNQDTCALQLLPPARDLQQDATFQGSTDIIAGIPNAALYSHDTVTADTFYLMPNWTHEGITPRYESFNLLFRTHYLVPATVPIVYTTGSHQWQANFLSAGMAYGWAYGRTKFYRDNLMPARNFYFGAGLIGGVSTVTLNSQNVSDTTVLDKIGKGSSATYPAVFGGGHIAFSFNSVQLMIVGGWESVFGPYHAAWLNQGKFFAGIGIGLSIFNLVIPSASPGSGGNH